MRRARRGRPPTLAIIFASREDAGAERYVRVIAAAAARRGWTVQAAFPARQATAGLREDLRAAGVGCHRLRVGPIRESMRAAPTSYGLCIPPAFRSFIMDSGFPTTFLK